MAGVFVKNGKIEPQRDTAIKLNGAHGGYNPNRDGSVKGKQLAARDIKKEIEDLNNGHDADLDNVLAELPVNGKRDPTQEAQKENEALDAEMKKMKEILNEEQELAKYVGSKLAGMAQDVKSNGRK